MIDLWYLNVKIITQEEVTVLLKTLPDEISTDIGRLRNYEDRCLKLFGRLMVRKFFEEKNGNFDWKEWYVLNNGKPYYYNRNFEFNISHSGNYVVVAFSNQKIGVDIEKIAEFDIASVTDNFHPDEIEYINSSANTFESFFKIWTRKEAYLKATGKGIIDGLSNENCLLDTLISDEIYFLHTLPLVVDYQLALCCSVQNCEINYKALRPIDFLIK